MSYHGRIMNLPIQDDDAKKAFAYLCGHRDARHAAAEIALEAETEIENLQDDAKTLAHMIGCAEASGFDSLSEAIAIAGKAEEFRATVKRGLEELRAELEGAPNLRQAYALHYLNATIAKLFGEDAK